MALSPPARRALGRILLAAGLLAAALALYSGRKRFIQSFFERGAGGAEPPALAPPPASPTGAVAAGLPPAELVRVALLDGVDRATALRLPHYDQMCKLGLELVVDVGFPTVSLPVQSVLWTGLTQQQSGIEFVQEHVAPPPDGSLPAREPSSAAVSESHPFIAQSFGFAQAWPPLDSTPAAIAQWKAGPFAFKALEQVGSSTRLVFVHLVGPDSAAHKFGRDSREFEAAAAAADKTLGDLIAIDAANHGPRSRWLVLADHGHRAAGGHGGEERDLRLVRACVAGSGVASATAVRGHLIHMVDLSRALADSLGLAPHPRSAGRPIFGALAAPEQPGVSLPRSGPLRLVIAALLIAGGAGGVVAGCAAQLAPALVVGAGLSVGGRDRGRAHAVDADDLQAARPVDLRGRPARPLPAGGAGRPGRARRKRAARGADRAAVSGGGMRRVRGAVLARSAARAAVERAAQHVPGAAVQRRRGGSASLSRSSRPFRVRSRFTAGNVWYRVLSSRTVSGSRSARSWRSPGSRDRS